MNKTEICQFVLSTRLKQDLSQSQLAYSIRKRRQAIIEIEKGIVDFRIATFLSVVDALGCEIKIVPKDQSHIFDFSKIKPVLVKHMGPFPKIKKSVK